MGDQLRPWERAVMRRRSSCGVHAPEEGRRDVGAGGRGGRWWLELELWAGRGVYMWCVEREGCWTGPPRGVLYVGVELVELE
jgi:hypothetical protein